MVEETEIPKKFLKKKAYFDRVIDLFEKYNRILLVHADNVGSAHMQQIRASLRDRATLLMGKNTLIRKALRDHLSNNPNLEVLMNKIVGNVGIVFITDEDCDLAGIRKEILDLTVGAPAKAGAIAPCSVVVPKGNTGLEPTQTSFLQALNIATKINRGQIEIISDVRLIEEGDKVTPSQATLLQKLSIKPFAYGLKVVQVYDDGFCYDPSILDLTDEDLIGKWREGLSNVAALSLSVGFPTLASVPHSLINAAKNAIAVAVEADFEIEAAKSILEYLADPEKFAAAAAAAAPAGDDAKEEEEEEEEEEESDDDMGFGLFD